MSGRLAGIARHERPLGPIELLESAELVEGQGVAGDFRGAHKPGPNGRRGLSLIEAADWAEAAAECGTELEWWNRRANLLVDGFELPQEPGATLRIGACLVEISDECEPCARMEALHPGLRAALAPDWRGGVLAKVVRGGKIAVGDEIGVER